MAFTQIAVIEHEIEARLLESVLNERQIPHRLRSYYDLAYDGLFQASRGWGTVYAAEEYRDEIIAVLADIRQSTV